MTQENIERNENTLEQVRKFLIDHNLVITNVEMSMSQKIRTLSGKTGYLKGFYNVNFDVVFGAEK